MKRLLLILAAVVLAVSFADAQSQVKKSTVPGITNFSQVETTVACAGFQPNREPTSTGKPQQRRLLA